MKKLQKRLKNLRKQKKLKQSKKELKLKRLNKLGLRKLIGLKQKGFKEKLKE